MNYLEQQIASWGNYPRITSKILRLEKQRDYSALMGHHPLIGRGLGRSYGDAALNDLGYTVLMTHFNKLLRFDSESGILTAQAGVSLDDILKIFVPRGWFLPVTPGTKFVTIGGAIASNVHGKNHHQDGAIGQYVKQLKLLSADGEIITCSPGKNREIYLATLGSNGLTGIILEAAIQLKRIETAYINQLNIKAGNFFEAFEIFDTYDKSYQYSVAWIDCLASVKNLGRSIVMFGNHATSEDYSGNPQDKLSIHTDPRLNIPFQFPGFALNTLSIKTFNGLYYHKSISKEKKFTGHYNPFFYPLDILHNWNRIYGKKGLLQWQCVLPTAAGKEGMQKILTKIRDAGYGSFLAVLKKMAAEEGFIHFPIEGYTLALDFPIKKGVFSFLDELDEIVSNYGGRIYLSKDARLKKDTFVKMYPELDRWKQIKKDIDPKNRFQSSQAKRLGLITE